MADDDPAMAAFLLAGDNIRDAIKDIDGCDARLALTICLAECIVFGFSKKNDYPDEAMRLAQTVKDLGDIVVDFMSDDGDDDDGDDEDHSPRPPSPDLLRKFLERRRTTKVRP